MLYLIGLGLNKDGISKYGLEMAQRCKKVYLENFTVDFPFSKQELKEVIEKEITLLDREKVEDLSIVDEAKKKDVALLVYGSPLVATTHIVIIDEAKRSNVKVKVIHAGSILDAVAETGLQLYKFGKIASMPAWKKSFTPDSFMEIIKENKSINAHSLILIDIGLSFDDAMNQLQKSADNHQIKLDKILICQKLGTQRSKILYGNINLLKDSSRISPPFCIIIPGKLHFVEKEILESFSI